MARKHLHSHAHGGGSKYLIDDYYRLDLLQVRDADIQRFGPNYLAWIAREHARDRRGEDAEAVSEAALQTINNHPLSKKIRPVVYNDVWKSLTATARLVEDTIKLLAQHECDLPEPVRAHRSKLETELMYLKYEKEPT